MNRPYSNLNPLIDVCNALRQLHPSMTIAQLHVFLLLAVDPDMSQVALEQRAGISNASASRIIAMLAQFGNRGIEPLNLLHSSTNPKDRRFRELTLAPRGRLLAEQLMSLISPRKTE